MMDREEDEEEVLKKRYVRIRKLGRKIIKTKEGRKFVASLKV